MNQLFKGLFRGLASHAGQAIAGVIITGVLGTFGIDSNEDSQTDNQTDSQTDNQDLSDSTNENTNA
ncbi:hypothetical protein JYQ62_20150 [Nostoc sp. UHCC 0702]|nr:hypothetical protein JYQ62_20150 [Nostoc sp. UHCC 0702]